MPSKDDSQYPAAPELSRCPHTGQVLNVASGPAGAYLATELATAPPPRLRRMLVDAAVSCCRETVDALDAGDAETARLQLQRARRVLRQLRDTFGGPADEHTRRAFELYTRADSMLTEAGHYTRRRTVLETLDLLVSRRSVLTTPSSPTHARSSSWLA
ncbi:MAG: flagellar protein FliS [Phycisphaerae bacterium]